MSDDPLAEFLALSPEEQRARLAQLQAPPATQKAESSTVGVMVGRDNTGQITVYINGRREKPAAQRLAEYLVDLQRQCSVVRLDGMRDRSGLNDTQEMTLDRVYTQLATTASMRHEDLRDLAADDAAVARYLRYRSDRDALPEQQRTSVEIYPPGPARARDRDGLRGAAASWADVVPGSGQSLYATGPELVSAAIDAHPQLVLLGAPGSGKSTVLRYLALRLAQAGLDNTLDVAKLLPGWRAGNLLPVLVPLRPLARRLSAAVNTDSPADALWNYLADTLEAGGRRAGLAEAVAEELRQQNVILLLDGLDEIAGTDQRAAVTTAIAAFAQQHPACRIVVACRVRAYAVAQQEGWQLPGWPVSVLAEWNLGQMRAFAVAWYDAVAALDGRDTVWAARQSGDLAQTIRARPELQRIGRQPLMMTIMALVHDNDTSLPRDRVVLYRRCMELLLAQWEKAKEHSEYGRLMDFMGLPQFDVKQLLPLFSEAALLAHRAARPGEAGSLRKADLKDIVDRGLERLGVAERTLPITRFLEYVDGRAGLLQANASQDEFTFPHQSFQEYLAGIQLVQGAQPTDAIWPLRHDDRWRGAILLGVAEMSQTTVAPVHHLLCRLVDQPGRAPADHTPDLLLAAEISEDLGWEQLCTRDELFISVRQRLATALAATLGTATMPATTRVAAGRALGGVGDLRPGVCGFPLDMVRFARPQQFTIGAGGHGDERGGRPMTLRPFALARYPITNAQYQVFMADGGYELTQRWWQGTAGVWLRRVQMTAPRDWDNPRVGIVRPNHPVVSISWYEARAFCMWLSQSTQHNEASAQFVLPSEAEWEYAARGPQARTYPWGQEEPDAERANYNQVYNGTSAVGCFPAGRTPEEIEDLAGTVWEWTRSEFRQYPYDPDDGRKAGDDVSQKRFTRRGGGWFNHSLDLRAARRGSNAPDSHLDFLGFRLALHLNL